jgi:hypothetical protein
MNALIGLVIFILGLIFSGILYMFGVVQMTPIPYNIWLLISILSFLISYKVRFKNKKVLKFFLLKKWVEFNSWFNKIDNKMTVGNHKLSSMQEKAVKLWRICLKEKNCKLDCSISSRQRQIESGKILIVLTPGGTDYSTMSIFDGTDNAKCNFYEVSIPQPHLDQIYQQFDDMVYRRMSNKEQKNREMVEEVFDTMISKQEKLLSSY